MVALSRPATTTSTLCSPLSTLLLPTSIWNSIQKCCLGKFLAANTFTSHHKCAWPYFLFAANKRLIWTIITTSRINLFATAIFRHIKICNIHRVYSLNHILNELEVKLKDTNFLLQCCNKINSKTSEYELSVIFNSLPVIEIHNTWHALQNNI